MRNPEATRNRLLQAAFHEMYRCGFQAASLHTILQQAGVTKGALYHHFPNKKALGHAIIDEVIPQKLEEMWFRPLEDASDLTIAVPNILRALQSGSHADVLELGCPFNNLSQEMSPLDEDFRQRLERLSRMCCQRLATIFGRAQASGRFRSDINPMHIATFVFATIEGTISLAKNSRDPAMIEACCEGLMQYFATLRP